MPNGADSLEIRYGPALRAAWSQSILSDISERAERTLLSSATLIDLVDGDYVPSSRHDSIQNQRQGQPALVVSGLVRVFMMTADRQVTMQYCSESDVFGIPALPMQKEASGMSAHGQALTNCRLLLLSQSTLNELLETDITVTQMAIDGMRQALNASMSLMSSNVLRPLRQRVAWHLLDLAVRDGRRIVVPATVQSIANATGTVREVVTRSLKEFRDEELIGRDAGKLVLLDLRKLHQVAQE